VYFDETETITYLNVVGYSFKLRGAAVGLTLPVEDSVEPTVDLEVVTVDLLVNYAK